jgi:MerR family transcriptional regulator, heat shock protein HspR
VAPRRESSSRPPKLPSPASSRASNAVTEISRDARPGRDPARPVYVISVAAELVRVHPRTLRIYELEGLICPSRNPRTLRIYELEGLICPSRTPTNIRLFSENDIRRVLWIRHLTRNLGVNLAGVRVLFELEERLGMRILETLYENRDTALYPATDETATPAEATAEQAQGVR